MDKITYISKLKIVKDNTKSAINTEMVEMLEQMLEHAKAGDIDHMVAVTYSSATRVVYDGWSYPEDGQNPYAMIGALRSIEHDLLELTIERRG